MGQSTLLVPCRCSWTQRVVNKSYITPATFGAVFSCPADRSKGDLVSIYRTPKLATFHISFYCCRKFYGITRLTGVNSRDGVPCEKFVFLVNVGKGSKTVANKGKCTLVSTALFLGHQTHLLSCARLNQLYPADSFRKVLSRRSSFVSFC